MIPYNRTDRIMNRDIINAVDDGYVINRPLGEHESGLNGITLVGNAKNEKLVRLDVAKGSDVAVQAMLLTAMAESGKFSREGSDDKGTKFMYTGDGSPRAAVLDIARNSPVIQETMKKSVEKRENAIRAENAAAGEAASEALQKKMAANDREASAKSTAEALSAKLKQ